MQPPLLYPPMQPPLLYPLMHYPPTLVGGPVDTSQVPAGEPIPGGPAFGPPEGVDPAEWGAVAPGPITMSVGGPAAASSAGPRMLDTPTGKIILAAAAGGILWYVMKRTKAAPARARKRRR